MGTPAERLLQQLEADVGQRDETEAERMLRELETQQGAETTPFRLPMRPASPSRYGTGGLREQSLRPMRVSPEARAAAEAGVDVLSGSPVGRFASGFSQNQATRAEDLRRRLSQHFGQDIQMRVGPQSGQLEFLNPRTNRFTTVDEARFTMRDLADVIGPSIPMLGAGIGEILGGPGGAALGGAAGEAARRGIGQRMGVRDEDPESFARGVTGVGAAEGAFSVGGNLAVRGAQGVRNFFRPRIVTPEQATAVLSEAEAAQEVANEIARRTGQPLQPTTGQMSQDPLLLGGEARVATSPDTGPAFREQLRQNETTLERFFDQVTPTGAQPNAQTGAAVRREARQRAQQRIQPIEEGVQAQVRELEELTAALPRARTAQMGSELRQLAEQARKELKENYEDVAWDNVRIMAGVNPNTALSNVKIPVTDNLRTTLNRLQVEGREALLPSQQAGKATLTPDTLTGKGAARDAAERALAQGADQDEAARIYRETLENYEVDLNQLNETISELRRLDRISRRGEVATDPSGRDRARLLSALVTQRNEHLRQANPQLLAAIEEAEELTAKRARLFDKGLVGGLLAKTDGQYTITDPEVVGRTLASGNPDAIRHLVTTFAEHPAGIPTLQRSMLALYRNEVVENGIPQRNLHRRFMERHGDVIDELFPNSRQIRQLGEFEKVVNRNLERFENFKKAVERSFHGKIDNLAPERVAERAMSDQFTEAEVKRLMQLADAAGVKDQYRRAVGDQLRRQFISPTSGLQLKRMDDFVQKQSDRLANIFGPKYVSDLRTLLRGLKTIRTQASGIATTQNRTLGETIAEGGLRVSVARPLSPGGVALTRALRFRQRAADRVLSEVIRDPDALRAVVVQANTDVKSRKVAQLLAVLGGSTLAIDAGELAAGISGDEGL